jgi:hypothetical protein
MTSPQKGLRRNSFRLINDSTFLDVILGRILNVSRERRDGADHIVTEFQGGTLILSVEETAEYVALLSKLLGVPVPVQDAFASWGNAYDDDDYELRHMQ